MRAIIYNMLYNYSTRLHCALITLAILEQHSGSAFKIIYHGERMIVEHGTRYHFWPNLLSLRAAVVRAAAYDILMQHTCTLSRITQLRIRDTARCACAHNEEEDWQAVTFTATRLYCLGI